MPHCFATVLLLHKFVDTCLVLLGIQSYPNFVFIIIEEVFVIYFNLNSGFFPLFMIWHVA